jgi:moderate conductance mechanosensitive channel
MPMPPWLEALLGHPIVGTLLKLVLLAVVFLFVRRALQLGLARLQGRLERQVPEADRRGRLTTLLFAGYGVVVVLVGALTLAMLLEAVGVNIGPLLASAGVAGLAVSLGAQTLIRDYIGGVLILVEDNFRVGDVIEVNTLSGEVTRITLRTTYLRNLEGKLHVVPNGDIRTVTNLTRDWSRAVVDVTLDYGADTARINHAMEAVTLRLKDDPDLKDALMGPAEVLSWNNHTELGVQVRVMVKTLAGQNWRVGRALRQMVLEALQAEGLRPARPVTIMQGEQPGVA